jgi:hypothetical protein
MQIRFRSTFLAAVVALGLASSAQAAVKFYDASIANGTPGDSIVSTPEFCPPVQTTFGDREGYSRVLDDGLGTVTLAEQVITEATIGDIAGPDNPLIALFGPGAFVFADVQSTVSTSVANISNTSGVGAHGPSGTAPGETVEWGIVSGFQITGAGFCVSSPTSICTQQVGGHGFTFLPTLPSNTYDLGTWTFDGAGDMDSGFYIHGTRNGGISNTQWRLRGALAGASLPALPLVGFGTLAVALAAIGGRALLGRK